MKEVVIFLFILLVYLLINISISYWFSTPTGKYRIRVKITKDGNKKYFSQYQISIFKLVKIWKNFLEDYNVFFYYIVWCDTIWGAKNKINERIDKLKKIKSQKVEFKKYIDYP